jgi:hypothetical protein
MNINQINGLDRVHENQSRHPVKRKAGAGSDQVDFSGTEALNRALKSQPESRSEKVDRLRDIASSLNYPPEELIRGISRLIANHLSKSEES